MKYVGAFNTKGDDYFCAATKLTMSKRLDQYVHVNFKESDLYSDKIHQLRRGKQANKQKYYSVNINYYLVIFQSHSASYTAGQTANNLCDSKLKD